MAMLQAEGSDHGMKRDMLQAATCHPSRSGANIQLLPRMLKKEMEGLDTLLLKGRHNDVLCLLESMHPNYESVSVAVLPIWVGWRAKS